MSIFEKSLELRKLEVDVNASTATRNHSDSVKSGRRRVYTASELVGFEEPNEDGRTKKKGITGTIDTIPNEREEVHLQRDRDQGRQSGIGQEGTRF